jgi:hypothetical protein
VAANAPAGTTDITLTGVNASNDLAQNLVISSQNGTVTVTAPTAASVSGRVMTASGRGIRNVIITMTDSQGNERTATTSSVGYYRFDNIAAGKP